MCAARVARRAAKEEVEQDDVGFFDTLDTEGRRDAAAAAEGGVVTGSGAVCSDGESA